MLYEFKMLGMKVLCLVIVAPLLASSLLYIIEKLESAWAVRSRKKKFYALTMLMVFVGVCCGWLL